MKSSTTGPNETADMTATKVEKITTCTAKFLYSTVSCEVETSTKLELQHSSMACNLYS